MDKREVKKLHRPTCSEINQFGQGAQAPTLDYCTTLIVALPLHWEEQINMGDV